MNAKLFAVIAYKMDEFSFEYIEICFGISTNIINSCSFHYISHHILRLYTMM